MNKFRALFVGVVAMASMLAAATSASALTVSPAGTYNVNSGSTVLTYPSTGQRLSCTSSRITGTINSDGTGSIAAGGMTFASCSNGLLGSFTVALTSAATLQVTLSGSTTLGLRVTIPAGGITLTAGSCRITVGGTVAFSRTYAAALPITVATTDAFTNSGSTLTTTSSTCSPAITIAGLAANYSASYTLDRSVTVSG